MTMHRCNRVARRARGSLPDGALRLVREWATLHLAEIEADWRRAREGQPLERIPPLAEHEPMAELVHLTAVEVPSDHCLHLRFEDGAEGEVDLSSCRWHGVFALLEDPEYFRQVTLDEELGT